jgi:hypothetical protein
METGRAVTDVSNAQMQNLSFMEEQVSVLEHSVWWCAAVFYNYSTNLVSQLLGSLLSKINNQEKFSRHKTISLIRLEKFGQTWLAP